jgi:methylated-DNA-[protein]-cysteine S-methyltransferase
MKEVRTQLKQYFQGDLKYFNLKTDFHISLFYKKALKVVEKIPYATTKSYKKVAINIGSPNGHRAVANANAKNPIPIVIPCHRVIKSNGELGEYGGGNQLKKDLLKFERNNLT